jgi:hypothetical protein
LDEFLGIFDQINTGKSGIGGFLKNRIKPTQAQSKPLDESRYCEGSARVDQ